MVRAAPHIHAIFSKVIATFLVVAILSVGLDFHHARGADVRHQPDSVVSLTQENHSNPASDLAIGADHYCHSCVVLVAIDGDARQLHAKNPAPAASTATVLLGMMAAPPGRPPRTAIPAI
jgi:hypothetical protein